MLSLCLIVSSLLFLASGCDNTTPNQTPHYSLYLVELDSIWILDSPQFERIIVQAIPPEIGHRRTIRCIVNGNGVSTHFYLYDDGSELPRTDGQGFCDSLSGDVVAGDGKFSRRFNSLFTSRAGTYDLSLAFQDHPAGIDTLYASFIVAANSPATIRWDTIPDSIESGSIPPMFRAQVNDLDGFDDIARVQIGRSAVPRGPLQRALNEMNRANDSIYQFQFLPELAAGYPSGFHSFYCRVTDWAMAERDEYSSTEAVQVWLENAPPRIDSIAAPDTVWVQGGNTDSTKFFIDLFLHEDQTPLDIDTLLLTVTRYDSTQEREIVSFSAFYFDNMGNDTLSGPGQIRTGFSATRNSRLSTPFTFTWTPTDKSPQRGESGSNVIVIMLNGNGMPGRDVNDGADQRNVVNPFR